MLTLRPYQGEAVAAVLAAHAQGKQQTLALLHHGELRYPSRSEGLFAALTRLVKAGLDDATIAAALLDPACVAGAKARERGAPWLTQELARARRAVRTTLTRYRKAGMTMAQIALVL